MHILLVALLSLGILLTQVLMGGYNLLASLPGYGLIAVAAIFTLLLSFRRIHPGVRWWAVLSALALAGYVSWRALTSPVEYLARQDFFMVLASLAVYLVTAFYLRTARERWWVLYVLLGLAVLHLAGGVMQFVYGQQFMLLQLVPDGPLLPKLFRPFYESRASGFYGCPNHLAGFLEALGLMALAGTWLSRSKTIGRVLFGYFIVVCLIGVAITGSRGGYLSSIFGGAIFVGLTLWLMRKLRSRYFWLAGIASVVLAAGLIGGGYFLMSRSSLLESRMANMQDVENVRILLWKSALQQYQQSPVIGTGSGTYLYYGRQYRAATVQQDPIHVHNDYLELIAEYGATGGAVMGVFIILHFWSGFRGLKSIIRSRLRPAQRFFSDEMALGIGALAALSALLVHSILDFNFHIPGNTLFYAFLFGILASPTSDPKITSDKAPRWTWLARLAVPALGGVLLYLGVPLLKGEYHAEWARIQLRNLMFVNAASTVQRNTFLLTSAVGVGWPVPNLAGDLPWGPELIRGFYLPQAEKHVQACLQTEKKNPNLYYYWGEVRRLMAVYLPVNDPQTGQPWAQGREAKFRELQALAGDAYSDGLRYFPQDVRLQLKVAQVMDTLGLLEQSEGIYVTALAADPNLAEIYAHYGVHHFLRKKLLRAEAYYRRALKFGGNDLAAQGLQDIAEIRAKAKDVEFVEQFGDPLEDFDMEPPTVEDERHGAILHE